MAAKLYDFKDHPEHRAQLDPWARKWIANAMSTAAMTEEDREACRSAVVGLYATAKLAPPKHIVFVITIIKLDRAPEGFREMAPAERTARGWIISHSESGHHHVLTGGDVMERTKDVPEGMKILYAILESPGELVQDAQVPHGKYELPAGFYELRIAREFDPFADQARRVAD